MLNPFTQNLYYVQCPSHYIPISFKCMQLYVNLFLCHPTLFYCTISFLWGYFKQLIHLPRQAVQRSPAGLLDPAHDDSTSLRNSSKYSSADAVKHRRKLKCWQHRCKNVKSRIPYTWLFCWGIQNPVRLQVFTVVTIQTAVFQQGTPRSAAQYKCTSLSKVSTCHHLISTLDAVSVPECIMSNGCISE